MSIHYVFGSGRRWYEGAIPDKRQPLTIALESNPAWPLRPMGLTGSSQFDGSEIASFTPGISSLCTFDTLITCY